MNKILTLIAVLFMLSASTVLAQDLCDSYHDKYRVCVEAGESGSNVDYDDCGTYTNETDCTNAGCFWNDQGLPAPGTCVVDICLADSDFSGRVSGADLTVLKRDLGRVSCPTTPDEANHCPYGMIDCGDKCVDPMTDREYCGASVGCIGETVCEDGEICVNGICEVSCQTGLTECSGICVDTDTDESNCGSCSNICSSGKICVAGNCEAYCSDNYAPVPKTGQTTSYATGDDGDLEKGVAWANPRFIDNGDGTVTDNLTGLIWLKDANCFGQRTWNNALSDSNGLSSGSCGLSDGSNSGDWRLPNLKEFQSLIDDSQYDPALPLGHPFDNVRSDDYWSATTSAAGTTYAERMDMYYGDMAGYSKLSTYYVWPVRGGND